MLKSLIELALNNGYFKLELVSKFLFFNKITCGGIVSTKIKLYSKKLIWSIGACDISRA